MGKSPKKDAPVLPVGATHFFAVAGCEPQPIPKGISIRSRSSVQIEFMWQGRRYTEALAGPPTEAAVRDAITKRDNVLLDIRMNRFVYENAFPNSRRVARERDQAKGAQQQIQVTMSELLDDWLQQYAKEHRNQHNTLNTHMEIVKSRIRPAVLQLRPAEITKDWVINFRHGLYAAGLKQKRVENVMTSLRKALDMAVDRGLVARNAARDLTPSSRSKRSEVLLDAFGNPAFDEPIPTTLNPRYADQAKSADPLLAEDRKKVLAQMAGQIRNIFLFAMWTGLRTGELIALRWCDVSPDGRRVLVRLAFSKTVFTKTKGRRARWVDLTQPAIDVIRAQRELTGRAGKWVFHNPKTNDRWQNSQRMRVHWIRALAAAGVRYRAQYQCRHTYASLMASAGESPEWIAEQMGHLDGRLVAEVYATWLEPSSFRPGEAAAKVYAAEWEDAERLVSRENVMPVDEGDELSSVPEEEELDEEEEAF